MDNPNFSSIKLHEPEAITFTFQAVGWKIMTAITLVTLAYFISRRLLQYFRHQYRREAIRSILQFKDHDMEAWANHLSINIKCVAITTYGRPQVAALSGDAWLEFLSKKCPKTDAQQLSLLLQSTYNIGVLKNLTAAQRKNLQYSVIYWIQHHA